MLAETVMTGNTNKGNITVQIPQKSAFVGGLHTMGYDEVCDEEILLDTAKALKDSNAEYYTCHCTGKEQFLFLQKEVGDKMHSISCGDTIEIR